MWNLGLQKLLKKKIVQVEPWEKKNSACYASAKSTIQVPFVMAKKNSYKTNGKAILHTVAAPTELDFMDWCWWKNVS